jgi:hypothetical protein
MSDGIVLAEGARLHSSVIAPMEFRALRCSSIGQDPYTTAIRIVDQQTGEQVYP